jgi:hypothetical protein
MGAMIVLMVLPMPAVADSFGDRVIISPDVSFLWNFQRGVEEVIRFVKFTTPMRIEYSLELLERRIGEMETLVNKSESFVPVVESQYEAEISKIETEILSLDIVSRFVSADYNLTQRLSANIKALEAAAKLAKTSGGYFASAMERTYQCMKVAG